MNRPPPEVMDALVADPVDEQRKVKLMVGPRILSHDAETFKRNFTRICGLPCKIEPTAEQIKTGHIGRNDICLCGSGKKFKKCCLLRKT